MAEKKCRKSNPEVDLQLNIQLKIGISSTSVFLSAT